jgi:predicted DNA-binding transcriptional regulator YafY
LRVLRGSPDSRRTWRQGGSCPSGSPAGSTPCSDPSLHRPPREFPAAQTAVLLAVADAVRHQRPTRITDTADGRRSDRTLHPYGLIVHSARRHVTGADPGIGEDRTFRLDRIADARTLPGSLEPPAGLDPAQRVLSGSPGPRTGIT